MGFLGNIFKKIKTLTFFTEAPQQNKAIKKLPKTTFILGKITHQSVAIFICETTA